jgi:DNA-binding MarR family transcriptional regulator
MGRAREKPVRRNAAVEQARHAALRRPPGQESAAIDYDVLNAHLGYLIRRAQVWIFQDFIRTLADADIRPAQYSVMVVVGANPGSSQISLSQALGIERARLVRVLHELEGRRLIERRRSASDGRSHALHLTGEGSALLATARALAAEHERNLRQRLGAERWQSLLRLLDGLPN